MIAWHLVNSLLSCRQDHSIERTGVPMRANADARIRRKQLGRLLRRVREAAGLTQKAVAAELDCGQAKINKIETTLVAIDPPELEKLIGLYRVPPEDADELRALARLDQQDGPARTKQVPTLAAFDDLSDVETEASEIRCWHSERIPGPLQSEIYRLEQHQLPRADDDMVTNDAVTNEAVTLVLRELAARTKVFTVPNPPRYRVILSESSLHRMPGGRTPEMVIDQATHLLTFMDKYETLELRILPFEADIPYVDTDFQHLMFDNDEQSEFVYIEYPGGTRKYKSTHELKACREHWAQLDAAALDVNQSRDFLIRLIASAEAPRS